MVPDVDVEHDGADEDEAADDGHLEADLLQRDSHRPEGFEDVGNLIYKFTSIVC